MVLHAHMHACKLFALQVEEADSLIAAVDTVPIAGTAAAPEEHAARAAAAAAAAASTAFRSFVVTGGDALYFRVDAQQVSNAHML
jgi:hypothetical protein